MCELLEVCVPICICMFRGCQFGLMGLMCIIQCFGNCCKGCCPECCECREKQKAISQEDVRVDTVDAAWGENKNKTQTQTKIPTLTQPARTSVPQHTMDSGWDDAPRNMEQSRMDEGWDTTPLNLEQPCIPEEPTNSPSSNLVVSTDPVPSAPPVTTIPVNNMATNITIPSYSASVNILPSESTVNYTSSDYSHPAAPPSYAESQTQDGSNAVA